MQTRSYILLNDRKTIKYFSTRVLNELPLVVEKIDKKGFYSFFLNNISFFYIFKKDNCFYIRLKSNIEKKNYDLLYNYDMQIEAFFSKAIFLYNQILNIKQNPEVNNVTYDDFAKEIEKNGYLLHIKKNEEDNEYYLYGFNDYWVVKFNVFLKEISIKEHPYFSNDKSTFNTFFYDGSINNALMNKILLSCKEHDECKKIINNAFYKYVVSEINKKSGGINTEFYKDHELTVNCNNGDIITIIEKDNNFYANYLDHGIKKVLNSKDYENNGELASSFYNISEESKSANLNLFSNLDCKTKSSFDSMIKYINTFPNVLIEYDNLYCLVLNKENRKEYFHFVILKDSTVAFRMKNQLIGKYHSKILKKGGITKIKLKIEKILYQKKERKNIQDIDRVTFESTLNIEDLGLFNEINNAVKNRINKVETLSKHNSFSYFEENHLSNGYYGYIYRINRNKSDRKLYFNSRNYGDRHSHYGEIIFIKENLAKILDVISQTEKPIDKKNDLSINKGIIEKQGEKINELDKKLQEVLMILRNFNKNINVEDLTESNAKKEDQDKTNKVETKEVSFGELVWITNPNRCKVLVIGESVVSINDLKKALSAINIDPNRFEFILEYNALKNNDSLINSLKRKSNDYTDILFGPLPHSMTGKGNDSSFICYIENETNIMPRAVRVMTGNELKITKSSFVEAVKKTIFYKKINEQNN